MLPPQEPIRFENEGLNLYGWLHRPEGERPHPVVTFCHGFTGQCYEPGWIFVRCARRMAEAGIAVFRFDCRFSGNSDGEFRDMTISTEVADALRALEVVEAQPGLDANRMGMLGFSMGGTVAAETAEKHGRIRTLCLWAPVSDPMQQFGSRAVEFQDGLLDLGPVVLGEGFAQDMPNHKPVEAAARWGGPIRIIHGEQDATVALDSGKAYLNGPGRREFLPIPNGEHGWFTEAVQNALFDATVQWFRETL